MPEKEHDSGVGGQDPLEPFRTAFDTYERALAEQLGEAQRACGEAVVANGRSWEEAARAGDARATQDCVQSFVSDVKDVWKGLQEACQDAFNAYLEASGSARLSATELAPAELAVIARADELVAANAASTIGNVGLLVALGVPSHFLPLVVGA